METKSIIAMIVGIALVLATTATVYTQSAFALATHAEASPGQGGVTGQQTPPIASCTGSTALHNPNCPS